MDTETRQIHNFQKGDLFDRHYRLLERVGSGGFADVWQAEDELLNAVVALKIYTRLDRDAISELAKEYKDMRGIKHPNLLTGSHFDACGNIPYLVMDYCEGGSILGKIGKMSSVELRHILHDVCNGLVYLHAEGIVHQDIKPENILYDTQHKRYLISDFGISGRTRTRLSKSVNRATASSYMTESYAPPEKFSSNIDDQEPDAKGDIFSLGMTIFELAVGKLPYAYPMATGREMLYSQGRLQLDYSRIEDPQIRLLVERCTRYRKADRATAKEALAMLDNKNSEVGKNIGEKNGGVRPPTVKYRTGSGANQSIGGRVTPLGPAVSSSSKWLYVGIAVAAIVAVGGIMILSSKGSHEPEDITTVISVNYGQWQGSRIDGKPTGEGRLLYYSDDQDGRSLYEGSMREGLREDSDATLVYKNGNTYKGSFVNDQFGTGQLTLKTDGLYFKGDFSNNKPYNGVWYWNDGTVYSFIVNGEEKIQ